MAAGLDRDPPRLLLSVLQALLETANEAGAQMKIAVFRRKGRSIRERFYDLCVPEPNSGCWLWLGGLAGSGYGRFNVGNNTQVQAHRFAWELECGPIPEGLQACHKCDVRCCVNPEHLFLGTQSDNLCDMVEKGRDNPRRGELHGKARLAEFEVASIRLDARPLRVIAEQYGVDKQYIWKLKRGWHWRHSHDSEAVDDRESRQARGRMIRVRGETHPKAVLTESEVRQIRLDTRGKRVIAREYGVSAHTIMLIRQRKIWKHVV